METKTIPRNPKEPVETLNNNIKFEAGHLKIKSI